MAYGKNKGLAKGGKKGQKKKQLDPFMRKVWYDMKAPSYFNGKRGGKVAKTCVTKTTGTKIETDGLKGRVGEFNLSDLKDEGDGVRDESNHKKIKLEVQEIQGKSCLTDFHGMSITRDRMCYLIKKRHSLIDVVADVKTTDGFTVRMFAMAFTKKNDGQVKCYTYAQTAQIKKMRKRMIQVMQSEAAKGQLSDLVKGLVVEKFENAMKAATQRIFPLDPLCIHKVKVVKKPKMHIVKLMEIHEKSGADDSAVVDDSNQDAEAKNLLAA
jgi:small subunit ribosomal protein S3Ae